MRFEGLFAAAFEDKEVLGPGPAQVVRIEIAGFVQDFGMREQDRISRFAARPDDDPTGEVLAEIDDLLAFWRSQDLDCMEDLLFLYRFVAGSDEVVFRKIFGLHA